MFRTLISTALITFATALPSLADVEIETARGPAMVPDNPQKIAVLDLAALDTLEALGIPVAGTVAKRFVGYLDDITAEPVGSIFEPDLEALNALAPDLIIVGSRSAELVDDLAQFAPTIDMTIWGDNLVAQSLARVAAYGTIFAKNAEAQALTASFNATLEAAKAATADKGTALIVMTNGPKISAYGKGSRFGWLHNELGLAEAVAGVDDSTHGEAISFEFIREADPDWLIVIDRVAAIGAEGENAKQTLDNELVTDTKAWKSGQVVFLDSAPIYITGGGYQSMMMTMKQITTAFGGGT